MVEKDWKLNIFFKQLVPLKNKTKGQTMQTNYDEYDIGLTDQSEKYEILEAFGADIFFDDQDVHLELSKSVVPSAKVIHKSIEEFKK